MKHFILICLTLIVSLAFGQSTYLHCGKLVDTKNKKVLSEHTIIVEGNKIKEVFNGYIQPKSSDDRVIDLKSKTVMPGLIEIRRWCQSS